MTSNGSPATSAVSASWRACAACSSMDYGFIPNKQLTQGAKVEKCRVLLGHPSHGPMYACDSATSRARRLGRPSCDFRFWQGQEEEIERRYLQIASHIREKERAQQASRMGEDMRARVLSLTSARPERMKQMHTAV